MNTPTSSTQAQSVADGSQYITNGYCFTYPAIDPWNEREKQLRELDQLINHYETLENLSNRESTTWTEGIQDRIDQAIHLCLDTLFPLTQVTLDPPQEPTNSKVISDDIYNSLMGNTWTKAQPEVVLHGAKVVEGDPTKLSDNLDYLCQSKTNINYCHWAQIEYYLHHIKGCKVARRAWDNIANQEYVTWVDGPKHIQGQANGGLAKFYINAKSDFYKAVEHTYKPTQQDAEAEDWYIL